VLSLSICGKGWNAPDTHEKAPRLPSRSGTTEESRATAR
jgi:hypothetical protein